MADETIYLGRPGALVAIHAPRGGVEATRIRRTDVFELGSGGTRVGRLPGGKRRYVLRYKSLSRADVHVLMAYEQGHNGFEPLCLLDPGQRNLLTANQSSATSETYGADNFAVSGSGGTIGSETGTANFVRGPRSIRWSFSVSSPASALLRLTAPSPDWPGIPVVARPLCFSFRVKGGGTDTVIRLTPTLNWLDAAGAALTPTTGTPTDTSGAFAQMSVTGSPPANTVYVNCSVAASGASISSGAIAYLDQFMLNEGSVPDAAWSPGTAVVPVVPLSLVDRWVWGWPGYRDDPVLVLQEVGP